MSEAIATQTQTQRRAATKKAAATRKRNAARGARKSVDAPSTGLAAFTRRAERALSVPVGAALAAREGIVGAARPWTDRDRARRELRKLERRGTTTLRRSQRNVEREARSTRRHVERGVDGVQSDAEKLVGRARKRVQRIA